LEEDGSMTGKSFDVIVVGGGPAGAASAIKCAQLGYRTLLLEKGAPPRHKPCGGVFPSICTEVLSDLGLKLPQEVMCTPPTLSLFYVPPEGRRKGGAVRGYRLLNVNRDLFDRWLQKASQNFGVDVRFKAEFKGLRFAGGRVEVAAEVDGEKARFSALYFVGADGALSQVRRKLYPCRRMKMFTALQEWWEAEGDFSDCFYVFFKQEIAPLYAYVVPKDGFFVLGTALPTGSFKQMSTRMEKFKEWLRREFSFHPIRLVKEEAAVLPHDRPVNGEDRVVLIGDAAGFCNQFSGEGVRLAMESGITAAESIDIAEHSGERLSSVYSRRVEDLNMFIRKTQESTSNLTDEAAGEFVKSELKRSLPL